MKNKLFSVLGLCLLFSLPAQAWFHFEPGIGYNKGQLNASAVQGIGLDLKLGFDIKSFFIVADEGYHNLQQSSVNSVTYTDTSIVFGGTMHGYRMWYGIMSSCGYSYTSGATSASETGNGTKLGLSGEINNSLFLNLEARFYNLTSSTTNSVTTAVSDLATIGYLSLSYVL
jgi:hypothetical protein